MKLWVSILLIPLTVAVLPSSAHTQTIDSRVKKLEEKTDYYKKKNKVLRKSKSRKNAATNSSVSPASGCGDLEFSFDPGLTSGGTLYVWAKATVTYSGYSGGVGNRISAHLGSTLGGMALESITTVSQTAGVAEVKVFNSFPAIPGSGALLRIQTDDFCMEKADVVLKTTLIEVIEPN